MIFVAACNFSFVHVMWPCLAHFIYFSPFLVCNGRTLSFYFLLTVEVVLILSNFCIQIEESKLILDQAISNNACFSLQLLAGRWWTYPILFSPFLPNQYAQICNSLANNKRCRNEFAD